MLNRTLDAGGILLRPIAPQDAGALHAQMTWDVARWLAPVPWPQPREGMQAFAAAAAEQVRGGTAAHHVVVVDGEVAGLISLAPVDHAMNLGYWLGRAFWGRGIMSAAAEAYVDAFFGASKAAHVTSGVFCGNAASLRVQDKLGFVVVGEGKKFSKAHGRALPHVDTVLGRARRCGEALAA